MSDHKYDVCICGHGQFEHEIPFRPVTRRSDKKICNHCNCNVFESVGQLSYDDWAEYKKAIRIL